MPDAQMQITAAEAVQLGASDSDFFCRYFFPRTMRQPSPPFHRKMWGLLESNNRLVNLQVFRGGAKTTFLRLLAAKRIAYGLSKTILYVGKSEGHALRSVKWLRRQIEYNKPFFETFNLRPGKKWQDVEAEIWHGTEEQPIWIMASGITGSVRGINQEDFRPDLIIIDDVCDEENSATAEQRMKIKNLVYGALIESLAPESEAPNAMIAALQTPLNKEDYSTEALADSAWVSASFGCWTPDTADLPLTQQESAWPERWSNAVLRKDKQAAIDRNQLSLWLREKECKIVSPETSAFRSEWLQRYDLAPSPMRCILVIDPVPPPSDLQIAKGLRGKDFEALTVVGTHGGNFYLLDYSLNRGHDPEWTIAEFFRLALLYRPTRVLVEAVAYQRTLAWLLRKAMNHQHKYFVVEEYTDKRSKFDRIVDGLAPVTSNRHLFVKNTQVEFIEQFNNYPAVSHDDLIETVAVGVSALSGIAWMGDDDGAANDVFTDLLAEEKQIPSLEFGLVAP